MVTSVLWLGESLVLGIVMIGVGLLLILVSMPLAKGLVRAHQYNYRPWQPIKLTDEEKDRLGRPTAKATIAVAFLYVLAGLTSIAMGRRATPARWSCTCSSGRSYCRFLCSWR